MEDTMKKCLVLVMLLMASATTLWATENKEAEFLQQGKGYLAAGKYKKAVQAFEYAARINPNSADAMQGMGMSYLKLGANDVMVNQEMLGQAVTAFNRALSLNHGFAEARYNLGITYLALSDKQAAVKQYDSLKSLDKSLAQTLSARIGEYRPAQKYKSVGRSGDQQQPVKNQRANGGAVAAPAQKPPAPKRFTGTVEMYGADWCPRCREAKQYMTEKGISFVYHNIDEDAGARSAFNDLGGGGVPLIMIGSKKMRGFSPESLEFRLNNN
jgi:tetratricopeptide (TPR) repeat protein